MFDFDEQEELTVSDFMRGRCWDMAIAVSEATGMMLGGLFDDNRLCHHAYAYSPTQNLYFDVRGWQTLDQISHGCAGRTPEEVTISFLENECMGRKISQEEIDLALAFAEKRGLGNYIEPCAALSR